MWIDAIMIRATNKSDRPLKNVKATIIPDMTDQKMDMRVIPHGIILSPEESATLIPPRAQFDLMVAIPSKTDPARGLPAEQFLADYGGLRFVFEYDSGVSDGREFTLPYIEDQIAFIEEKTKELRRAPIRQDKKSDSGVGGGDRASFSAEVGRPSAFKMSVGESGPFFDTKGSGLYDIKRMFNLKVENAERNTALTNCKISIIGIAPQTEYDLPCTLKEGFSLAPGDHAFVPLISYGEARNPASYPCGDPFMSMGTQEGSPHLNVGPEYRITLRATAMETSWADIQCKSWVDGTGRLRIKAADAISDALHAGPLQLVLPNEANLDSKESLFKRSWTPLPSGHGLDRRVSVHQFFVGVRYGSDDRTLRNVRLVLERIHGSGARILNDSCICDRNKGDSIDIQPRGMEYFLIGEGADNSDGGMFHPAIMSKEDYDRLLSDLDSRAHVGFVLKPKDTVLSLLKNDGQVIEISAYADDTPPTPGKLTINTRKRIEVFLEGGTNVE